MSRRHPKRFAERPIDPRSRGVVSVTHYSGKSYILELDCGHRTRRRFNTPPARLLCRECPQKGGVRR